MTKGLVTFAGHQNAQNNDFFFFSQSQCFDEKTKTNKQTRIVSNGFSLLKYGIRNLELVKICNEQPYHRYLYLTKINIR
jgi:hypothetical protein